MDVELKMDMPEAVTNCGVQSGVRGRRPANDFDPVRLWCKNALLALCIQTQQNRDQHLVTTPPAAPAPYATQFQP
jgi:hypothetical protein